MGEPSGGAPNQWGDRNPIELPTVGLTAYVAAVYVEVAGDRRHAVSPRTCWSSPRPPTSWPAAIPRYAARPLTALNSSAQSLG